MQQQRQLIPVRFAGDLADRFGDRHEFRAGSLKELGSAFRVCIPGFEEHILAQDKLGVAYRCIARKSSGAAVTISPELMGAPLGSVEEVVITPVMVGSGGKLWNFVGGALLLGVGLAVPGVGFLATAGASFILGGIAQLLAPAPITPKSNADKESSYLFSGLRGSADEDSCVPLVYGRVKMPLALLISQKVTTAEFRL